MSDKTVNAAFASTPCVQAELGIVEANIKKAVEALAKQGIAHRPHIKAHKSVALAKMQLQAGCKGITCAKLGEAEVMAAGGIDDILLAYPLIGEDKLLRYKALLEKGVALRTVINSLEGASGLSALGNAMGQKLPVLVELDGGIGRGGLPLGEALDGFLCHLKEFTGLSVEGVEYYGGDIYGLQTGEEIRARAAREREDILAAAEQLRRIGFHPAVLSGGSSFSLLYPEELRGLTEVRAGNYLFRDNALLSLGLVAKTDCALRVLATVVSRPAENTAILDAGSKTLSSDLVPYADGYGHILEQPDAVIYKLNEEHGFVRGTSPLPWRVGDVVHIIPNHACVVPNLFDTICGVRNGAAEQPIAIDARGKVQ